MKTIIEMAGKAFETPGVEPAFRNGFWTVTSEELEAFAELVRADERDELLDIVYSYADNLSWNDDFQAAIRARGQA
jgi:hypothetical protein